MDVLLLADPGRLDALIDTVERQPSLGALPGWIGTSGDAGQDAALLDQAIRARRLQGLIALRERNFAVALARLEVPFARRVLSIVISTYNRALFVSANVAGS